MGPILGNESATLLSIIGGNHIFLFFIFFKVIFPRRAGLDRKHNVAYIKSSPVGRENSMRKSL